MHKIIISVAPVAVSGDPEKVANDVIACAKAGASMVHLHVKDADGNPTADTTIFEDTITRIRQGCDIVIEGSTGAAGISIADRCAPLQLPLVEMCTYNIGTRNEGESVFINTMADMRYCLDQILANGKNAEVDVVSIGDIYSYLDIVKDPKYAAFAPKVMTFGLGHEGSAPPTLEAMVALRNFIPDGFLWGFAHLNRTDYSLLAGAMAMGATVMKIGLEDSCYLDADTKVDTNLPLVEKLVSIAKMMGIQIATPEEARQMMNLKPLA